MDATTASPDAVHHPLPPQHSPLIITRGLVFGALGIHGEMQPTGLDRRSTQPQTMTLFSSARRSLPTLSLLHQLPPACPLRLGPTKMTAATPTATTATITVGVLALQGAFSEHIQLLRRAACRVARAGSAPSATRPTFSFAEIRTPAQLAACDALIIPGGESTTMSLVASRSGLLAPLREFVKVRRRPVWGTCAGLILLAEQADRTKKGGQELIGGLAVRVRRNHFGRQGESFVEELRLPFLGSDGDGEPEPYRCVFIRAPVVEGVLGDRPSTDSAREGEDVVLAPSKAAGDAWAREAEVEVMARLAAKAEGGDEAVVAVRQGNVFGCSFHPELTEDARMHAWWLSEVGKAVETRREREGVA